MFGSADDDDLDFNPSAGSKLASLFGLERSADKGNASLTYTAPKQPKGHQPLEDNSLPSKRSGNAATSTSNRLSLIVMKVVTTFKLEDGSYNPQGKLGMALLGNSSSKLFQLLLYKGKQQQITAVKISPHFQFTVQPHLYATFYDDRTQNWSIMFENREDAIEFTVQVAVARYRAASPTEECIISQEILPGKGYCFKEGETVKLKLSAQPFTVDSLEVVNLQNSIIECTLTHNIVNSGWAASVVGASHGSIRTILVPLKTQLPWLSSKRNEPLLVEVTVSGIKSLDAEVDEEICVNDLKKISSSGAGSGVESAVDSGAEDPSVRARGASIKEALTNSPRANKASIISRMARMGQATLPLKGAIVCNPSDSEETEEDAGMTGKVKPPVKTRPSKSRLTPSSVRQQAVTSQPLETVSVKGAVSSGPGTITVIPTSNHWNNHQQNLMPRTGADSSVVQIMTSEGQLVSLSSQQQLPLVAASSTMMSPSDPTPQLSMFLSEARMQNTEMRMHLSKVSDKMDQLMSKVDNLHSSASPTGGTSATGMGLEPNVLLSSIEKLVLDNSTLQAEVAEKNKRLDEQNERIFSLLNTNSRFLEQSSSLLEQKQLQEQMQQKHEHQQQEQLQQVQFIQQLQDEKASMATQLTSLQNQLVTLQELVQALQKSNSEINQELESARSRLQEKEKLICEMNSTKHVPDTENQLHQLNQAVERQKAINQQLQEQIASSQAKFDSEKRTADDIFKNAEKQLMAEISLLKDQLTKQANIHQGEFTNLQAENKELQKKLEEQPKQKDESSISSSVQVIADVKSLMNTLHKSLIQQFKSGDHYDGAQIRKIITSIVKREALSFVEKMEGQNDFENILTNVTSGNKNSQTDVGMAKQTGSAYKREQEPIISEDVGFMNAPPVVPPDLGKPEEANSGSPSAVTSSHMPPPELSPTNNLTKGTNQNSEFQSELKKDQDSSFESSWRPLPPPPPLFNDEDDSDDWLP